MQIINRSLIKSFTVHYKDEKYYLLSYENSEIIDQIINNIPYSRNSLGESNLNVSLVVSNNCILLDSLSYSSNKDENSSFLNKAFHKKDKTFFLEDLNYVLNNSNFVIAKDYIDEEMERRPYILPYEFASVLIFFQGEFYNISSLISELMSLDYNIYLEFKNPKVAILKYNEIVSKYNLPFDFNNILSFEDYYDYKMFNKGDKYGVLRA